MEIFPDNVKRFWNGWEIRMLVLLSLTLQTILTIFGSRRKHNVSIFLRVIVWLAYLSADWVATVVLGNLATSDVDSGEKSPNPNGEIHAFWAPFLLLHLGGPDTITAYSLEDNELWLRHLLALAVQVTVSIYVFLRFWTNTVLTFLAIPIFIVASIKYGERTLALRFASNEQFKEFLLSGNPRGLELVTFMKGRVKEDLEKIENRHFLVVAYVLLKRFVFLFAGQLIGFSEEEMISKIFKENKENAKKAFLWVEVELGFMYDLLYTKGGMVYSRFGILLRCFSLLLSVSIFIVCSIFIDVHAYPVVDIILTYLLLIGTIVLETYTFILHFFSDWISLYFSSKTRQKRKVVSHSCLSYHKRWSESMGQFNIINFCTKKEMPSAYTRIEKLLGIKKLLENRWHTTWEAANIVELKELIYCELLSKIKYYENLRPSMLWTEIRQTLLAKRGDFVLKDRYKILDPGILQLTGSEAYNCSLISWHIATHICYSHDLKEHNGGNTENLRLRREISKRLSDYMLYLMALCPTLIPEGSEIWFKQTCEHYIFSRESGIVAHDQMSKKTEENAIPDPLISTEITVDFPSAVGPGYWISDRLQLLESEDGWSNERKWEMISEVWVEMLTYASTHSAWYAHGQYLRRGGELITHVRLLVAHLGLTDQYKTT